MTAPAEPPRVWAVVPAAGVGRRMGCLKQSLPFGDGTMGATVTHTLLRAGAAGIAVVTRSELVARLLLPQDARIAVAINDDADSQMIDSVRIGWRTLAEVFSPRATDGVLIAPADMPRLSVMACRTCVETYRRTPARLIVAAHAGRRGHPLIIPWTLWPQLEALGGGLNELLRSDNLAVHEVETGPEAVQDVDTWADYERLTGNALPRPPARQ